MRVKALDRAIPLPVVVSFVAAGTIFFFSLVGMILLLAAAWLSPAHAQDATPKAPQCTAATLANVEGFIAKNADKKTVGFDDPQAAQTFLKALSGGKIDVPATKVTLVQIPEHEMWVAFVFGDNCAYGGIPLPNQIVEIVMKKLGGAG